jgi:hypothetical protein
MCGFWPLQVFDVTDPTKLANNTPPVLQVYSRNVRPAVVRTCSAHDCRAGTPPSAHQPTHQLQRRVPHNYTKVPY